MKPLSSLLNDNADANKAPLSYKQLLEKRRQGNKAFIDELASNGKKERLESLIGRSGISPLHKLCTVSNYVADSEGQKNARQFTHHYILEFYKKPGRNYVFSGGTGTGKNHLSSAICNKLIKDGRSCLIITISELMIKLRRCYKAKSKYNEDEFISSMVNFDFLVLDEVGLQRGSNSEKLILNQIIDQRTCNFKSTAILTNLNAENLETTLGARIMDRMRMNDGAWIAFNWSSYRN